jgi:hypothetical protein
LLLPKVLNSETHQSKLSHRPSSVHNQAGLPACRLFLGGWAAVIDGRAADLQAFSWLPGGFFWRLAYRLLLGGF